MNPPIHPTSLGAVGNWQLLVAFLLHLACRPSGLSGRTPVGIPARAPLARSSTITRSPVPLPVEPRPNFLPPIWSAPALRHHLGQHSISLRCLGSRSWRNGLGLCIGNGLGSGVRELRARLCYLLVLVCLLSRSIAFFCLSLACLCFSCLSFVSPSSNWCRTSGLLVFRALRSFGRRIYIRVVYVGSQSLSSPRSN
jgi:hypothetical protein